MPICNRDALLQLTKMNAASFNAGNKGVKD